MKLYEQLEQIAKEELVVPFEIRLQDGDICSLYLSKINYKHYKIKINRGLFEEDKEANLLSIVAHEMGHCRDYIFNYGKNPISFWKMHMKDPLPMERLAWFYAVDYLKRIGFIDWDIFHKEADRGYSSYHRFSYVRGMPEELELERFRSDLYAYVHSI